MCVFIPVWLGVFGGFRGWRPEDNVYCYSFHAWPPFKKCFLLFCFVLFCFVCFVSRFHSVCSGFSGTHSVDLTGHKLRGSPASTSWVLELKASLLSGQDRVSLWSPGCHRTSFVNQAGLELRNQPASASGVLGLKASTTLPSHLALSLLFLLLIYLFPF